MRARTIVAFFALVFLGVGLLIWRDRSPQAPSPALVEAPAALPPPQSLASGRREFRPTPAAWTEGQRGAPAAPGTYIPRGFDPNFRQRIVADFQETIDRKLGPDYPAEKRKRAAQIQMEFWDQHGPNTDLYAEGKISQPEFAERTHTAMLNWMEKYGSLFTEEEYQKLFDVPRDFDVFYALFHSKNEQPGMRFDVGSHGTSHPEATEPPKPAPGPNSGPATNPPQKGTWLAASPQ